MKFIGTILGLIDAGIASIPLGIFSFFWGMIRYLGVILGLAFAGVLLIKLVYGFGPPEDRGVAEVLLVSLILSGLLTGLSGVLLPVYNPDGVSHYEGTVFGNSVNLRAVTNSDIELGWRAVFIFVYMLGLQYWLFLHKDSTLVLITREKAEIAATCGANVKYGPKFVTQMDVTGDGVDDLIFDYSAAQCLYLCDSAGCPLKIYVDGPDGARVFFDDTVRGWSLLKTGFRPVLLLDGHGSACERSGAASCKSRLIWNGSKFVPAP